MYVCGCVCVCEGGRKSSLYTSRRPPRAEHRRGGFPCLLHLLLRILKTPSSFSQTLQCAHAPAHDYQRQWIWPPSSASQPPTRSNPETTPPGSFHFVLLEAFWPSPNQNKYWRNFEFVPCRWTYLFNIKTFLYNWKWNENQYQNNIQFR